MLANNYQHVSTVHQRQRPDETRWQSIRLNRTRRPRKMYRNLETWRTTGNGKNKRTTVHFRNKRYSGKRTTNVKGSKRTAYKQQSENEKLDESSKIWTITEWVLNGFCFDFVIDSFLNVVKSYKVIKYKLLWLSQVDKYDYISLKLIHSWIVYFKYNKVVNTVFLEGGRKQI